MQISPPTPPEKQSFTAKLANFEHEIEIKRPNSSTSRLGNNAPPPPGMTDSYELRMNQCAIAGKISLLSTEDMLKMKEEEKSKLQVQGKHGVVSPDDGDQRGFEHLLENRRVNRCMQGSGQLV